MNTLKLLLITISIATIYSAQALILPSNSDLNYQYQTDIRSHLGIDQKARLKAIHMNNLKTIEDFYQIDVETYVPEGMDEIDANKLDAIDFNKPQYISKREANEVIKDSHSHPVVSLSKYDKYDPESKGIGFCFGRAMYVHLELVHKKLDRDSIKKAFVVGRMSTGDGNSWGWHVTTIAQSKDENGNEVWLALDPILSQGYQLSRLKTLDEWYMEMYNNFSTDKKLKLYITEAGQFGSTPSVYNTDGLEHPFYNNYFKDLMKEFAKDTIGGKYDVPAFTDIQ